MARGREGAFGGKTLLKPYVWLAFCLVFLVGLADLRRPLSDAKPRSARAPRLHASRSCSSTAARSSAASRSPTPCSRICSAVGSGSASVVARRRCRPSGRRGCSRRRPSSCSASGSGSTSRRREESSTSGSPGSSAPTGSSTARRRTGTCRSAATLKPCGPEDAEGQVRERIQTNGRCEAAIERGDTYGPVSYLAYVPAVAVFDWSGKWDSLPAAHATSIAFDAARRPRAPCSSVCASRGRRLGVLLAFGWVAYPFTAYTLNANTNDAIMPVFLLVGFWLVTSDWARGVVRRPRRAGRSSARSSSHRSGRRIRLRAPHGCSASRPRSRSRRVLAFSILLLEPSLWDAAAHVLGSHDRLPVGPRLAVLDLGLGSVPRARHPRPRLPPAGRRGGRRRAGGSPRVRSAAEGPGRARGADRCRARRVPARR